jgi:hypothetical protein
MMIKLAPGLRDTLWRDWKARIGRGKTDALFDQSSF